MMRVKKPQQPKNKSLKNNLEEIYKNINKAKQPNTRVKLLAVTKTRTKKRTHNAEKLVKIMPKWNQKGLVLRPEMLIKSDPEPKRSLGTPRSNKIIKTGPPGI